MKNNLLSILLIGYASLSLCSCSNETSENDNSTTKAQVEYDTIITFDPNTLEETIEIVERTIESEDLSQVEYDTIITFDTKTFEETVKIVERPAKAEDN